MNLALSHHFRHESASPSPQRARWLRFSAVSRVAVSALRSLLALPQRQFPGTLALALAALLSPACKEDPSRLSWWESEQERIGLSQRLTLAQYQLRNSPVDYAPQLAELAGSTPVGGP